MRKLEASERQELNLGLPKWFTVIFREPGWPSVQWAYAKEFMKNSTRVKGAQRSFGRKPLFSAMQNIAFGKNVPWVSEDEFE